MLTTALFSRFAYRHLNVFADKALSAVRKGFGGHGPMLLVGVAGQIVGVTILGADFHFPQLASLWSYVVIGGSVIYIACFAFRRGSIFWHPIAEIYPLKTHGALACDVRVTNRTMNLAVAVTFLTLVGVLGRAGTFWLYGVIGIGSWSFFYQLVPETKGETFEPIESLWRAKKHQGAL